MAKRLNQIIASEAAVKAAATKQLTEIHKLNQKPELFEGLSKEYTPLAEDGERLPKEEKRVQLRTDEQLDKAIQLWREHMDLTYAKDVANTSAAADVVVNGSVIMKSVPVTFLLFLEKRLQDMAAVVTALPVLDEAYDWVRDQQGLYRTGAVQTHRTKKMQRPLVMYDATKEHPAQTQLITEDVVVGNYATVRTSGAISHPRKRQLIQRITQLQLAVKDAREQANLVEVQQGLSTQAVLDFVFSAQ